MENGPRLPIVIFYLELIKKGFIFQRQLMPQRTLSWLRFNPFFDYSLLLINLEEKMEAT
jgi:hypothetical protein